MSKGMTLIESLISLAIVSFGVFLIALIFPIIMGTTLSSKKDTAALFLATAKMEKMVTQSYGLIEEGTIIENYGTIDGYENYRREAVVSCFHPERSCQNEETGIKKITVSVFYDGNIEESVSLRSIVSKK